MSRHLVYVQLPLGNATGVFRQAFNTLTSGVLTSERLALSIFEMPCIVIWGYYVVRNTGGGRHVFN